MSVGSLSPRSVPGRALVLAPRSALLGAAGAILVLVLGWFLVFHDVSVAQADAHAYFGFVSLGHPHGWVRHLALAVTDLCLPLPFIVLTAVPVIVALLRRRWALALAILVMIPGAILTSETLKPLLAAHRPALGVPATGVSLGSWPSGHATAAMTLALGMIIASPARRRALVAVPATLFALAVAYSVLTLGWHYPSDVVAGFLVALAWALTAVAAVLTADARWGRSLGRPGGGQWIQDGGRRLSRIGAGLGAVGLIVLAALVWRGATLLDFIGRHRACALAAVTIAGAGILVPAALAVLVSGSERPRRILRAAPQR